MYTIAGILCVLVGIAHSYLGEKKIISPLLNHDGLPPIRGSEATTARVIRIAWHVTTLLFWIIGVLFFLMQQDRLNTYSVAMLLAVFFLPMGVVSLIASRGKHVSWPPFLIIGSICIYAAAS